MINLCYCSLQCHHSSSKESTVKNILNFFFSGYYCPAGTDKPLTCTLGQYCETSGLDTPTGLCTAGYFCNGTASIPNPAQCDMGYYCPEGTTVQEACAPGTYSGNLTQKRV